MPSHEEHCQHTLKRYGVRGDDIHKYLDEPCKVAGQGHREFRHDSNTVKLVGQIFEKKYGRELAENIALDHIMLDHKEKIKNRTDKTILLNCPNCSAPLTEDKGKRVCKYCGYEVEVLERLREESIDSVRLPGKHRPILLFRRNNNNVLPLVLPPLYIGPYLDTVIDEAYEKFDNKKEVEGYLEGLGYHIFTVEDFRNICHFTDRQIKELIWESKRVTHDQIMELIERAKSMPKSAKPKGCFIATAAYGTPMAEEINVLRTFRDRKLEPAYLGKRLILLYYRTSPSIAKIISQNEKMKAAVRYALKPIIRYLRAISIES